MVQNDNAAFSAALHTPSGKTAGECFGSFCLNGISISYAVFYGGNCHWECAWNAWGDSRVRWTGGWKTMHKSLRTVIFQHFMFDTVRKAFGLVTWEGVTVEPSRLLLDHPAASLQTTQGLTLWAALKAQWKLRCAVKYQRQQASLEDFVALWAGVLEKWRRERNMCYSKVDLHQGGSLRTRFFFVKDRPSSLPQGTTNRQPPTATNCQPPATANRHQPPTTASRHQPPITNHQPPPTTTNRHQPPFADCHQPWLNI